MIQTNCNALNFWFMAQRVSYKSNDNFHLNVSLMTQEKLSQFRYHDNSLLGNTDYLAAFRIDSNNTNTLNIKLLTITSENVSLTPITIFDYNTILFLAHRLFWNFSFFSRNRIGKERRNPDQVQVYCKLIFRYSNAFHRT